ncbi:uncharacterized protein LOC117110902 [Anneissia japonica]|uniref:uncharacterized protein LOC117110902 n=1 Tax=Anneissia japonica TaxID=1529436 RepID=UPI0014256EEF|nr:uncharacterized protein LOC117110902 [Anneissia japonica]XP_033109732.1 uncharacterized protein LOC117110902 [Anneissia japonica]XP_033109812.1 uncharacterized protein LOC117110902 [Anneissia japonica]
MTEGRVSEHQGYGRSILILEVTSHNVHMRSLALVQRSAAHDKLYSKLEKKDMNQETNIVQKREERIPSQFESCFRQFVNGDFKRRYITKCDFNDEQFRNGRPFDSPELCLQRHNHEDDPTDHNSMSTVNSHQTQCHQMTRVIQESNTFSIDKPTLISGSSFKEFINNNHHVTTPDTNGSTSEAINSERSFFSEFETFLDSFKTGFDASSFEDKSHKELQSLTPKVIMPSNVLLKGPPMVADLSACVHAPKTMRIGMKGTMVTDVISKANETALKVTKKIMKTPAFGSDKVVDLPAKSHQKHRKSTWDDTQAPDGVLKSILKRRSNFNHRCGKKRVTFAEGVLVSRKGLLTSEEHPIKSDDTMKETSRKRPKIELTRAQRSLSAIVKRLKMERANGKNVQDVPRAARTSVLMGMNLTSKDARHRTVKSIPAVVMSEKKSNTSVVGNNVYEEKKDIKRDESRCESLKEDHTEHMTHRIMHGEVKTREYLVQNNRNDDEIVKLVSDVHDMKSDVCESQSYAREKTTHRPTMNNCTKCNRKFKDIYNLQRHERAHSMEKLHACEFCKERFSLSSERNKHERTHGIEKTLCSCQE